MKFTLPARKPFNFLSVIYSHGWYQLTPFHFDEETNSLHYVLQLSNGRVIELKMREAEDGVGVETDKLDRSERKEVTDKVTWMFGLDMDFSRFYAASRDEPKLARAEGAARGRVLRSPTVFEDVVKTILTTNTLWGATKNMTRKLVNEFGVSLPKEHRDVVDGQADKRAFPSAASIAAGSPEILKENVRVGYRAPAIHQLAVRVASGELDLESLKTSTLPTLELRKELLKINGVGPYAAANLLMLLGRHDFIPIDSYALKMVSHEWYKGKPVTAKEVEKRFEKWGEFKGLAYWFWDWKYNG
jgi:3-methyladenine DNA glycosylase/8-oxoguanine DNA glycosylase